MAKTTRGIDMRKQKAWIDAIEKENKLRLKWFTKNESHLEDIANRLNTRTVSDEIKNDLKASRATEFENATRHATRFVEPAPAPLIDPDAIQNIMKPVDPATRNLIYSGSQKDGRLNYLHKRYLILPEDRYYFPETTSFQYGWKMWDCAKDVKDARYGRQQVIKESFYRRRGLERDPEWYKESAILSPNICGCN